MLFCLGGFMELLLLGGGLLLEGDLVWYNGVIMFILNPVFWMLSWCGWLLFAEPCTLTRDPFILWYRSTTPTA